MIYFKVLINILTNIDFKNWKILVILFSCRNNNFYTNVILKIDHSLLLFTMLQIHFPFTWFYNEFEFEIARL